MSDDLTVSGGGSTAVAVDGLFVDAARLGTAEAVVADWADRLGVIRRGLGGLDLEEPAVGRDPTSPVWFLDLAGVGLDQAGDRARWLRASLLEAAERYGATERLVDGLWRLGAALAAPWIGVALASPAVVMAALGVAAGQSAGAAVWRALGWGPTPLAGWLDGHRDLLADPAFVRLVRIAADHADEAAAGALHVPLPAPLIAGLGAGVQTPESASVMLALAGGLGMLGSRVLVDGPVRVVRTDRRPVDPPQSVGDLAARVPEPTADGPQIRVERYGERHDRRFIVYIGGTVELGLVAGEQAFDNTSNLHGVADDTGIDVLRQSGADSGAGERAVREALHDAGMRPGDPLLAVGYSGGAIVAAHLAADPDLGAVGAVSLGGPVASAPAAPGVPLLAIEHEEDFVPAVGGAGHPAAERVTVSRSALEPGRRYDAVFPAHELARYRETAELVDESDEARLVAFRDLVARVTDGGPGERSDWLATREVSSSPTDAR